MSRNGRVYSFPPFFWLPFLCIYVGVHVSRNMCKSQRAAFQEPILSFLPICFEMESHTATCRCSILRLPGPQALGGSPVSTFALAIGKLWSYTHVTISHFFCVGTRDQAGCQAYAETNIFPY